MAEVVVVVAADLTEAEAMESQDEMTDSMDESKRMDMVVDQVQDVARVA